MSSNSIPQSQTIIAPPFTLVTAMYEKFDLRRIVGILATRSAVRDGVQRRFCVAKPE